jgi:hypothetical protein
MRSRIAGIAARAAASPAAMLASLPEKSSVRVRGVAGRIATSAASTSCEPRHETSTPITTFAPMRRATGTGTRLVSPPSTYSVPAMMTGQNTFGILLEARTASPVLPRLNIVMRLVARSVAITANARSSASIERLPSARLT